MRDSLKILFHSLIILIFCAQGAFAACTSPAGVSGQMGYNVAGVFGYQYCDNTNWLTLDKERYAPVLHMKFDESSGNIAADSVNAYGIEVYNTPTWQTAGGQIGGAIDFSEASTQYGVFQTPVYISGDITYSFWMRRTSTSANWSAVLIEGDPSGFWIEPNGGVLWLYIDNNVVMGSPIATNGTWMHVAVTDDGTTSRLYINGVEDATSASRANFTLNSIAANVWGSYLYDGRIDDLRAYDHALSASEISALYANTLPSYVCATENAIEYLAAPVSKLAVCYQGGWQYFIAGATGAACAVSGRWTYSSNAYHFCNGANEITPLTLQVSEPTANLTQKWMLNESAGTNADNAVSASDGTLTNGAIWQSTGGRIGGALQFDGVDDYLSIPSVVLSDPFTFAFWMKRTANTDSDYMSIFTQDQYAGVWHDPYASGIVIYDGGGGTLLKGGAVPTNVWTHVALTDDGTTSRIYVNGTEVRNGTNRIGFTLNSFAHAFSGGSDGNFAGLLDDVRVYNAVLTAEQVKHLAISAP